MRDGGEKAMKDSTFRKLLALVIAAGLISAAALTARTVQLRRSVSILSYISTEGI